MQLNPDNGNAKWFMIISPFVDELSINLSLKVRSRGESIGFISICLEQRRL